jgi:Lon protease-like protein
MVNECLSEKPTILKAALSDDSIPSIHFGVSAVIKENLCKVGCGVTIEQVLARYPDGALDIGVRGVFRYTLQSIKRSEPYPLGEVDISSTELTSIKSFLHEEEEHLDESLRKTREKAIALHHRLLELASKQHAQVLTDHVTRMIIGNPSAFQLAHNGGLDLGERQTLLEIFNPLEQYLFLIEYYHKAIQLLEESYEVRERIGMNGHVRKLASIRI